MAKLKDGNDNKDTIKKLKTLIRDPVIYHKQYQKDLAKLQSPGRETVSKKSSKEKMKPKENSSSEKSSKEEDLRMNKLAGMIEEQEDYIEKLEYQMVKMHTRDNKLTMHMQHQEGLL